MRLAAALALCATGAAAQDWDCGDPALPQQGMNHCAHQDYLEADAELNANWSIVIDYMQSLPPRPGGISEEEGLREAQRAWISYRDLACAAEGVVFRGGSMEPLIVSTCLERLTRERTEDLVGLLPSG